MLNSTPFFSIVIPTYNRKEVLFKNLLSLENQTFRDFEVVVSDDGSNDGSYDLISSYCFNYDLKYIFSDNWGGPAKPRNLGINSSNGRWICFLDSDDFWFNNKLEIIYNRIRIDSFNINFIYHHNLRLSNNQNSVIFPSRPISLSTLLSSGNSIYLSSVCVSKMILSQIDGFSENPRFIGVEDYDLYIRLALNGCSFKYVTNTLGIYTIGHDNLSSDFLRQIEKVDYLLHEHVSRMDLNNSEQYMGKVDSLIDYMYGNYFTDKNDYLNAKIYFKKVFLYRTSSFLLKSKSLLKYIKCTLKY